MPPQTEFGSITEAVAKLRRSLQPSVQDAIAELDRSMRPFREAMEEHRRSVSALNESMAADFRRMREMSDALKAEMQASRRVAEIATMGLRSMLNSSSHTNWRLDWQALAQRLSRHSWLRQRMPA